MREINVSRAGDPVYAGDKALTGETPAQRGRVNRNMVFSGDILFSSVTKVSTCNTSYILDGNFS